MNVYAHIDDDKWMVCIQQETNQLIVEGQQEDPDPNRHQLKSMLEILCFLRKYSDETYKIYTNNVYSINCAEKWIPKWVERGFRIGNTEVLRPNTDLLVQLYAFRRCVDFELFQHYDSYETYQRLFQFDLPVEVEEVDEVDEVEEEVEVDEVEEEVEEDEWEEGIPA